MSDDERLLRWASQLVDGTEVDWDSVRREAPELDVELDGLRKLSALRSLFERLAGPRDEGRSSLAEAGWESEREGETPTGHWGHLEILETLGSGSFGTVYRAFDPVLQREVALKLWRDDGAGVDAHDLIQEARSMARVRHPNVLAVHGAEVHGGRIGLWSDLVTGRTLEDEIVDGGSVTHERWLEVALALASAIDAVHGADLVHGDVKTANVMTDAEGHILLMDFGASRPATTTAARVGSPLFMAPELFAGAAPTPATDAYALGVVLYRLACGEYPLQAESYEDLVELHRADGPLPTPKRALSADVRRLLVALLAADPVARPSMAVTLERLRFIASAPARRRRRIAVGSVIATLAVGTLVSTLGFLAARRSERRALAAQSETEAVNDFLRDVLVSPRPTESGAQTLVTEVLEKAHRELEIRFADLPLARARTLSILGKTHLQLYQLAEAEAALHEALPLLESHLGRDHVETLHAWVLWASLQARFGRWDEAARLLEDLVPRCEQTLGDEHEVTLLAILAAGNLAVDRQDFAAAESWAREVLARRAGERWEDDELRGLAQTVLGEVLNATARYGEAEDVLRSALEWALRTRGQRYGNTLLIQWALGRSLAGQGRMAEAEVFFRRVYDTAREWMGESQGYTLQALQGLSHVVRQQGRLDEALDLYETSIEMSRRVHGAEDRFTFNLMGSRANVLKDVGRTAEAEALYREAIAGLERAAGPDDEPALLHRTNLAELFLETGRPRAAAVQAEAARERMSVIFGDDHLFTLAARSIRGAALVDLGRVAEGAAHLQEVVARQVELFGERHPETLRGEVRLGAALAANGRFEEAQDLLVRVVQTSRDVLGPSHEITRGAEELLRAVRQRVLRASGE